MQRRSRTFLVGCDVRSDIRMLSGITYHLAKQGMQDGLLTGMLNLYPRGMAAWPIYARAIWWKLDGGLRARRGFKYTDIYLDRIWKRVLADLKNTTVINNFQLFGEYFLSEHERLGIRPYV